MPISLLFGRRKTVALISGDMTYDSLKQMNVITVDGQAQLAIDQPGRLPTNSKTRQAPGDDDPDIARESLY
jgi:hypothetical protein